MNNFRVLFAYLQKKLYLCTVKQYISNLNFTIMKNNFLIIIAIAAVLCSCCSKNYLEDKEYQFHIFRYADDSYKELIITDGCQNKEDGHCKIINGICNFPKRYRNEPYYGIRQRISANPEKYTFDICELATEEKLLALHGNYYTYFPYTRIFPDYESPIVVRDGKWSQICDVNPFDLPILGECRSIYSDIRSFEIGSLEKITGKSRKEMTIDDIEQAVNKVIDDGELEKYSKKVTDITASKE